MKHRKYIILIFIISLFMSIGYASLNSIMLEVKGSIFVELPNKIFISDVSTNTGTIIDYEDTILNSLVTLSSSEINTTSFFDITIFNNSGEKQYFNGVKYSSDLYSNNNIVFNIDNINKGGVINNQESKIIRITFKYSDDYKKIANIPYNNTLTSLITFDFNSSQKYNISYIGIDSTNLINSVDKNSSLNINFGSEKYIIDEIKMGNNILSNNDYTFINNILNIPSVIDDLIISLKQLSSFNFVIDEENLIYEENEISLNISDLLNKQYKCVNTSSKNINKIEVIYIYTSNTGSNQTGNVKLNYLDNTFNNSITFNGKTNNGSVSTIFDNINISNGVSFTIELLNNKLTNSNITIFGEEIHIYLE